MIKMCGGCRQELAEEMFSPSNWNRTTLSRRCRPCVAVSGAAHYTANRTERIAQRKAYRDAHLEEARIKEAEYRRTHPNTKKDWEQRVRYGSTLDDKQAMRESQDNRCACCGREFDDRYRVSLACTDHTEDGEGNIIIRGLLCNTCNRAIGMLGDTLEGLLRAVNYLQRAEAKCISTSTA